ncbi:MAG TPA: NUDIX domain-containing protein [Novosphingobium sp.]|nr:NUDIX domain-containing protein [Novosphingobium sp.]
MLHLIPPPLHRALLRLAHAARKAIWRVRRPRVAGCRVLALDGQGRVLLIRHSYGSRTWMPPGGGIHAGREDAVEAARRELLEETGCVIDAPRQVVAVTQDLHGASNRIHVVVGRTGSVPRADMREIVAARFFALDALPPDMARGLVEDLRGWIAAYHSSEN